MRVAIARTTIVVLAACFAITAAGPAAAEAAPEPSTVVGMAGQVARWVIASGDSQGRPFAVIDKVAATVAVYDPDGRLKGVTPALLGLAPGDDSVPGIGDRKLSAILPEERTTPAGRFVGGYGPAAGGKTVLWVDFGTAISMHPVVTTNRKERRLERLATSDFDDNRVTYGCINVPAAFYEEVVRKTFTGTKGVFYILPDTKPLAEVFPAMGLQARPSPAPDAPKDAAQLVEVSAPQALSEIQR